MQDCKSQLLNFQVFHESVDKLYIFIIGTEVGKVFSLNNITYMRKSLTVDYTLIGEGDGTLLHYSCLENPMDGGAWWAAVHGVTKSRTGLHGLIFTFHFHALEKGTATHSSVLAWRIPGTGEPGGLSSLGSHRVGDDWNDLVVLHVNANDIKLWINELTDWDSTPFGKSKLNCNHKLTTDTWIWQKSMKAFSDMRFTIKNIIYFSICKLVLHIYHISKIYSKLIHTHIFILKVILFLFCILLYTKAIITTKCQRCPPRW